LSRHLSHRSKNRHHEIAQGSSQSKEDFIGVEWSGIEGFTL
jgi:hypothetical protein